MSPHWAADPRPFYGFTQSSASSTVQCLRQWASILLVASLPTIKTMPTGRNPRSADSTPSSCRMNWKFPALHADKQKTQQYCVTWWTLRQRVLEISRQRFQALMPRIYRQQCFQIRARSRCWSQSLVPPLLLQHQSPVRAPFVCWHRPSPLIPGFPISIIGGIVWMSTHGTSEI